MPPQEGHGTRAYSTPSNLMRRTPPDHWLQSTPQIQRRLTEKEHPDQSDETEDRRSFQYSPFTPQVF